MDVKKIIESEPAESENLIMPLLKVNENTPTIEEIQSNSTNSTTIPENLETPQNSGHLKSLVPIKKIPGTELYTGVFYKVGMPRFWPSAWLTWTYKKDNDDQDTNFVQVAIDPKNALFYAEGGKWHEDVQWMFAPSPSEDDDGWYSFDNRGLSKLNYKESKKTSVTTWSQSKVGSGYHIVITKKADLVQPIQEGYLDPVNKLYQKFF